ncbi:MAG: fatty acid desaturase [Alphaproteobacteria bacterium]|nr:fatty acid desaturase [Alphaproteobacteria bacterium]
MSDSVYRVEGGAAVRPKSFSGTISIGAVEWPTLGLAAAVYGLWLFALWLTPQAPWWVVLPLGAFATCWHSQLQHELIHGHPTRSAQFNEALGFPALGLWLPYQRYRDLHLAHHLTPHLTDPVDDPESFYVTEAAWRRAGRIRRALLWANQTLLGRLTLGPFLCVGGFWLSEIRALLAGRFQHGRAWALHALGLVPVIAAVWSVGLSLAEYVLLFVLPSVTLTLLRSFAEHQPGPNQDDRTAIVEGGWLSGLLYLNNNLHIVHHQQPGLPWNRIPAAYRRDRAAYLSNAVFYSGYSGIVARYFLKPKQHPALEQTLPPADPPR